MAFGNDLSLLLRIKGDSSDGVRAVEKFKKELKELEKANKDQLSPLQNLAAQSGLTAERFDTLRTRALAVGAVVGTIAAGATATAAALLALTKASAEYGSAIFDASEKTGLTSETLSAMKFAADQSGASLESVVTASARFSRTIAEAAQGSEQAQDKLKRLGVTSTDLDTALGQALQTIVKLPPGIQQMAAAQDAFGRSGADLLPFIKSFDGDLGKLINTAKELGVTLSKEDVRAADEFGDTLDALKSQAQSLGFQFTKGLMVDITSAMKDISAALGHNQKAVKEWGEEVRQTLSGLKNTSAELYEFSQTKAGRVLSLLLFGHVLGVNEAIQQFADPKLPRPLTDRSQIEGTKPPPAVPNPDYLADIEKERKAREDARKRDLEAQKDHIKKTLQLERDAFDSVNKQVEADFEARKINEEQFRKESEANLAVYSARAKKLLLDAFKLDAKDKTAAEIENLRIAKTLANSAIDKEIVREREGRERLITATVQKEEDKRLGNIRQTLSDEVGIREAAGEKVIAALEAQFTRREITEGEFIRRRQAVETELERFRLQKLEEELKAVKGNAEEESRVLAAIAIQKEKIATQEEKQAKENAEFTTKNLEEQIDAYRELLEIRRQILQTERQLIDIQKNQQRFQLQQNVRSSTNVPERNAAVIALRDFEIEEATRRERQNQEDLEREKNASIARLSQVELELGKREELEELFREKSLLSEAEFQAELAEIRLAAAEEFQVSGGFFGGLEAAIESIGENISIVDVAADAFNNLANAIGSVVQQYVLYGKTAPAVLRQVLAATLAQIAAEAAVQAIRAAAYGFLFLAIGDYVAAGNAFASAALWAGIAVGAALLGRAIAPKQENAASASFAASSSRASGQPERNTSGQGQVHSSHGNDAAVDDRSINDPSRRGGFFGESRIKIELGEGLVAREIREDVQNNGPIRTAIQLVAAET